MKTISLKKSEIQKNWWIADAQGQILGRLASEIAQLLRGKHKVDFTPHLDMGDCVIVINAEKIEVTGKKEKDKTYFTHTGYPGGGKETSLADMRRSKPEKIIENAVKGMLPHNKLGRAILSHLKVYTGAEHPHEAQNPQKLRV
ncbi:50S ribosomal protein L13 [Candidatus Marinimicrobia bacterium]|jgi:large subunit ribosomal protein L13|nr:50S ribosomal protein L13 [Candidatus Neomarinimicrobiota bacterium]MDA8753415.1 50S ribosomal protein L13 [Candidatus Neomarinimicrobiota bacterium]MDC0383857.1 50S ribosomal protein L13 [Candidatus Neomarinimicrobiota bacterium]